jgi:hypothetical protein
MGDVTVRLGSAVRAVGAVGVAVHGWDVAEACACHQPIPLALATGILKIVPLVVTDAARDLHFAAPGSPWYGRTGAQSLAASGKDAMGCGSVGLARWTAPYSPSKPGSRTT